jgi:hypothetical protein
LALAQEEAVEAGVGVSVNAHDLPAAFGELPSAAS